MRGDGVGDVFDAAGGAGHQHMPDVALVLMRAGRADRGPPVAAADVGDPVRLTGRGVGGQHFTGGRVDGVAAADQPDRAGAVPDLLRPGRASGPDQGRDSRAATSAWVAVDQPSPDSSRWPSGRRRSSRVHAASGLDQPGRAVQGLGRLPSWVMSVVGVAGEPDPDGFGDAVDGDVADAGQPVRGSGRSSAPRFRAPGPSTRLTCSASVSRSAIRIGNRSRCGRTSLRGSWTAPTTTTPAARPWESSSPRAASIRRFDGPVVDPARSARRARRRSARSTAQPPTGCGVG